MPSFAADTISAEETCQMKETNRTVVQGKSIFLLCTPDQKYYIHDKLDNLKPQFEIMAKNMLLFIGAINWSIGCILCNTLANHQSQTQYAAENLSLILNTPYEDAMFHIRWSESLEISLHPEANSLKKNLTPVHPTRI